VNRLAKQPAIEKIAQTLASVALGAIGCSIFSQLPAQAAALTLQEATEAKLFFSGFEYPFNSELSIPFTAVGSMKYQDTPLEGSFYAIPQDVIFLAGPEDLPEGSSPERSFTITADQGYRLVTELNFTFPDAAYSYTSDLTYGSDVRNALLFRPPASPSFPSSGAALLQVNDGDGRNRSLFVMDYWFFGDSNSPLLLYSTGTFWGSNGGGTLSGTWKATAVPEPFSVLGTAAALIGGTYLKRRQVR